MQYRYMGIQAMGKMRNPVPSNETLQPHLLSGLGCS
jgi:hypothetical protein